MTSEYRAGYSITTTRREDMRREYLVSRFSNYFNEDERTSGVKELQITDIAVGLPIKDTEMLLDHIAYLYSRQETLWWL